MSGAARQASLEPPREAFDTPRRLMAEGLGTALLLAVVIGSGIMGERLAGGNDAIALLGNTLATGAALVVLITIFGPLSGAHFNPAVTLAFLLRRELSLATALAYVAALLSVLAVEIARRTPAQDSSGSAAGNDIVLAAIAEADRLVVHLATPDALACALDAWAVHHLDGGL